jgi:hypothetical protein
MARQYSTRSFLRHAPNSLLRRYLRRRRITKDLDWGSLRETQIDIIFEAIQSAPEGRRARIESDFRDIEEMATEGGIKTIIDEARDPVHGLDLTEELGAMESHYERAFWTMLNHPRIFDIASMFNRADNLPGRSWRKRKDLPRVKPATDEEAVARLEETLSSYYRQKEGRGHACQVEHYRRGERLYWFAYPQDYADSSVEYDEQGRFERRTRHPAFEVIFVHAPQEQSLDLYAKGDKKTVADLQEIWARAILGVDLEPLEKGEVVYELNLLKKRGFLFPTDPKDGIKDVRVKKMRLSVLGGANRRIILEADVRKNSQGVYDLLDEVLASKRISRHLLNVTQVGFQIVFLSEGARGTKTVNFEVSYPNSCSLKYEPKHEIAKKYLRQWGIDVSGRTVPGLRKARRTISPGGGAGIQRGRS